MSAIKNVAIVGAGGRSGKGMAEYLSKTGKHTVTAITRVGSSSELPEGITSKEINYDEPSTIVEALKGQDALVITLSAMTGPDTEAKLIDGAVEAGVSWILPNEWGCDSANEALINDVYIFKSKGKTREYLASKKGLSYIALSTGFWYEWSLGIENSWGFNFEKRTLTLVDEGDVKISTSTWRQVGRAVAALLSLPQDQLEQYRNKHVYVSSFYVSQKDMLESVLRVTGTQMSDWTITKENSKERYDKALKVVQSGDLSGYAKWMYTRVFFPDGVGNLESKTITDELGLPKDENMDDFTKVAIERQQKNPYM